MIVNYFLRNVIWALVIVAMCALFGVLLVAMASDIVESKLDSISDYIKIENHTVADCYTLSRVFNSEYVGVTEEQKQRAEILLKSCPPKIEVQNFDE